MVVASFGDGWNLVGKGEIFGRTTILTVINHLKTDIHLLGSFHDNLGKLAPERLNQAGFNEARDNGVVAASAGP